MDRAAGRVQAWRAGLVRRALPGVGQDRVRGRPAVHRRRGRGGAAGRAGRPGRHRPGAARRPAVVGEGAVRAGTAAVHRLQPGLHRHRAHPAADLVRGQPGHRSRACCPSSPTARIGAPDGAGGGGGVAGLAAARSAGRTWAPGGAGGGRPGARRPVRDRRVLGQPARVRAADRVVRRRTRPTRGGRPAVHPG